MEIKINSKIITKLGNTNLTSPLIIGSNDYLINFNMFELIANTSKYLGAFTTKSFTLNSSRSGNKNPIMATDNGNVLVSSGMRNPGAKIMLKEIEKYNKTFSTPLLISSIAIDPANNRYSPEEQLANLAINAYEHGSKFIEQIYLAQI